MLAAKRIEWNTNIHKKTDKDRNNFLAYMKYYPYDQESKSYSKGSVEKYFNNQKLNETMMYQPDDVYKRYSSMVFPSRKISYLRLATVNMDGTMNRGYDERQSLQVWAVEADDYIRLRDGLDKYMKEGGGGGIIVVIIIIIIGAGVIGFFIHRRRQNADGRKEFNENAKYDRKPSTLAEPTIG